MTESGSHRCNDMLHFCAYPLLPVGFPGRFANTDTLNLDVVVLEYGELWPELLHQAQLRGIPLVLHNGRFSRERLEGYQRLFQFTGNLVQRLNLLLVCATKRRMQRAIALGAGVERIFRSRATRNSTNVKAPLETDIRHQFQTSIHVSNNMVDQPSAAAPTRARRKFCSNASKTKA